MNDAFEDFTDEQLEGELTRRRKLAAKQYRVDFAKKVISRLQVAIDTDPCSINEITTTQYPEDDTWYQCGIRFRRPK